MEIKNSFTVPADIDTAWKTLLDVPSIAPCMPGATLTSQNGDEFTGNVKVKLGPVAMTFGGEARFTEKDEAAHRAVIVGSGKEAKGGGTAQVNVTTQLVAESPTTTRVDITSELTITGKAAQFGKGVMQDISSRLVDQFAGNLEQVIAASGDAAAAAAPAGGGSAESGATATAAPAKPAPVMNNEALDLGSVAMGPILKRAIPTVVVIVAVVGVIWYLVAR